MSGSTLPSTIAPTCGPGRPASWPTRSRWCGSPADIPVHGRGGFQTRPAGDSNHVGMTPPRFGRADEVADAWRELPATRAGFKPAPTTMLEDPALFDLPTPP